MFFLLEKVQNSRELFVQKQVINKDSKEIDFLNIYGFNFSRFLFASFSLLSHSSLSLSTSVV